MINNTYAIIKAGGKQIKAEAGQAIWIEKIDKEIDEKISFKDIIALSNNGKISLGTPIIEKVEVIATIQKHGKGPKLIIFRTKAKSNWSRKQGHRQPYTRLLVEQILLNGEIISKIGGFVKESNTDEIVKNLEVKKTTLATAKKPATKTTTTKKEVVKKEAIAISAKDLAASKAKIVKAFKVLHTKTTELNLNNLELKDIKEVAVKALNYLKSNGIETIADLNKLKAKDRDVLISKFPGLKSDDILIKNEKFLNLLKQINNSLEKANLDSSSKKINVEDLAASKAELTKELKLLYIKTTELKLEHLKLKNIKGPGVKTINYLKSNSIETFNDLINIKPKSRDILISGLPGAKTEDILIKNKKFLSLLKQAQKLLKETKLAEVNKAKNKDLKDVEISNAKVEAAHKALHTTATELNLGHLELIDIKGVGVKTFIHFKENNIKTINDLINIDPKKREELILGLPGLKSEDIKIKNEKFINFLNQAHNLLKENNK